VSETAAVKTERRENDAYYTDARLAKAIVGRLAEILRPEPRKIVEPTAGDGAFVKAAREVYGRNATIAAVDLNAKCRGACLHAGADHFIARDFLQIEPQAISRADLVLGNPPFNLAEEIIRHAYASLLPGASIAFLLAQNFLGSGGRWIGEKDGKTKAGLDPLFRACPLRFFIPVCPRPSFFGDEAGDRKGQTARYEYGVFVFTREWLDNATILDAIEWEKKS
jgi:hypothetical protein